MDARIDAALAEPRIDPLNKAHSSEALLCVTVLAEVAWKMAWAAVRWSACLQPSCAWPS